MKTFFSIIVLFFFSLSNYSQDFKIGFQSGWGSYKMSELKDLNQYILKNNPLSPKMISNYPSYYYYRPSIIFAYKKVNFGLIFSHQSTGSRISIKDYSGEYLFDSKIKSNAFGILGEVNVDPEKKLKFILYSELGFIKTQLTLTEFLKVFDNTITDDKYYFDSKNYYIEPGFKISYPLSFISLELNIGFFQQFGKKKFEGDKDVSLTVNGNKIKPDWSGLRFGLSFYFVIPFEKLK
ncbi:MAG: hypothetical protein EHM93_02795 [Bacteroidales bacterium]|nr:MAG: hypothetical protein EHM93_02795 [Bacteroidales bacterium]